MTERSKIADEIEAFVADDESYLVTLALARFIKANLPTILAALRADSPAAVERAAKTLSFRDVGPDETADEWWDGCEEDYRRIYRDDARAALRAALEPQP